MNRGEFRAYAKQRRLNARRQSWKRAEKGKVSVMAGFPLERQTDDGTLILKSGMSAPGFVQEVSNFWGEIDTDTAPKILFELGEEGLPENYRNDDICTRDRDFRFIHLTKEYQTLVFESYHQYRNGKVEPKYESETMLNALVKAKKILTPKEKDLLKALNSKVTCWNCNDQNQKIASIDLAFPCTNCDELLWVGEGGFVKVEGIYK